MPKCIEQQLDDRDLEDFKRSLSKLKGCGNLTAEYEICLSIGDLYVKMGKLYKSLEYFFSALSLSKAIKNSDFKCDTFNSIASVLSDSNIALWDKALMYVNYQLNECDRMSKSTTSKSYMETISEFTQEKYQSSNNIKANRQAAYFQQGIIYMERDDNLGVIFCKSYLQEAKKAFLSSISELEGLDESNEVIRIKTNVCLNLGLIYEKLGENDNSEIYFSTSLALAKSIQDNEALARYYTNNGMKLLERRDFISSEKSFTLASELYRAIENQSGIIDIIFRFSMLFEEWGFLDKAIESLHTCSAILRNTSLNSQSESSFFLALISERISEIETLIDRQSSAAELLSIADSSGALPWSQCQCSMKCTGLCFLQNNLLSPILNYETLFEAGVCCQNELKMPIDAIRYLWPLLNLSCPPWELGSVIGRSLVQLQLWKYANELWEKLCLIAPISTLDILRKADACYYLYLCQNNLNRQNHNGFILLALEYLDKVSHNDVFNNLSIVMKHFFNVLENIDIIRLQEHFVVAHEAFLNIDVKNLSIETGIDISKYCSIFSSTSLITSRSKEIFDYVEWLENSFDYFGERRPTKSIQSFASSGMVLQSKNHGKKVGLKLGKIPRTSEGDKKISKSISNYSSAINKLHMRGKFRSYLLDQDPNSNLFTNTKKFTKSDNDNHLANSNNFIDDDDDAIIVCRKAKKNNLLLSYAKENGHSDTILKNQYKFNRKRYIPKLKSKVNIILSDDDLIEMLTHDDSNNNGNLVTVENINSPKGHAIDSKENLISSNLISIDYNTLSSTAPFNDEFAHTQNYANSNLTTLTSNALPSLNTLSPTSQILIAKIRWENSSKRMLSIPLSLVELGSMTVNSLLSLALDGKNISNYKLCLSDGSELLSNTRLNLLMHLPEAFVFLIRESINSSSCVNSIENHSNNITIQNSFCVNNIHALTLLQRYEHACKHFQAPIIQAICSIMKNSTDTFYLSGRQLFSIHLTEKSFNLSPILTALGNGTIMKLVCFTDLPLISSHSLKLGLINCRQLNILRCGLYSDLNILSYFNFAYLTALDLSYNQLTDTLLFPLLVSLATSDCILLKSLNLRGNHLQGKWLINDWHYFVSSSSIAFLDISFNAGLTVDGLSSLLKPFFDRTSIAADIILQRAVIGPSCDHVKEPVSATESLDSNLKRISHLEIQGPFPDSIINQLLHELVLPNSKLKFLSLIDCLLTPLKLNIKGEPNCKNDILLFKRCSIDISGSILDISFFEEILYTDIEWELIKADRCQLNLEKTTKLISYLRGKCRYLSLCWNSTLIKNVCDFQTIVTSLKDVENCTVDLSFSFSTAESFNQIRTLWNSTPIISSEQRTIVEMVSISHVIIHCN